MTTTANTKQALAPGQQLTCPAGSATVFCQRVDNGHTGRPVFHVWVEQGGVVDGFDHTYPDETQARFEATRAVHLFRQYRTVHGVAARRTQLAETIREQEARHARRMHNPALLDAARTELDTLLGFADAEGLHHLRARITRIYAA